MTITVLLFASYADAFGQPSVSVTLPQGATVAEMITRLGDLAAGRGPLPTTPMVAVNQAYARYDHVLSAGDEVAVIPPVAGG
jgi:molybdopterin converting factor subunit 1